ncbi:hypothetical protein WL71_03465 [Burkholderia ubonensis]|uniref:Uncharacterized protein n=1 Tax=Burkholderia ubonensis TaxID=101571 RepID=A0A107F150_9BURK|nr:hypothetical protein WL70_13750 [Burkholderia ubonensis]KWD92336.1 hypothetical protein WL71_03465 [Burkholderia ubonensis]KWD94177.1 hypothetical protein WL72_26125 [Burkholderia ubonensis]KWD97056.1 hypothetical protein WL73_21670 [Burkholderia ubonensis]
MDALIGLISWPTVPCDGFLRFLAQMKKSLLLCVVSVIRQHRVQGMMNLRYFLETTSHAAYGLAHKDPAAYLKDGEIDDPKVISGKAYKWLEREYPTVSKEIKRMKDEINSETAHANILNSIYTFALEGEPVEAIRNELFDFDDPKQVMADLCNCAHAGVLALELLESVRLKYGGYFPARRGEPVPALRETNVRLRAALVECTDLRGQ